MDVIEIKSKLYDYGVYFIEDFSKELKNFAPATVYVIDKNLFDLYRSQFKALPLDHIYFVNPEENFKNMETVMDLIRFWKDLGVRKNWKAVCFGGGITQDITTIASNLFLRNIEWYFFPTTLLSMCDSCIGGKCGINLGPYKNQIGVFYPPKKILIDIHFLDTLSEMDYVNGWGELLKFSLTLGPEFYQELKNEKQYIPCANIAQYIHKGLSVKKAIIEEDEFESDLRRVLNYGHTFGHALEAYTSHRIPHGTAVIWGLDVVNYIAYQEGLVDEAFYMDVKNLIKKAFIKKEIEIENPHELFSVIKTDKKVKDNTLSFAMPDKPCHLAVYPMKIDLRLEKLFDDYLKETHEYYCN